MDLSQSDADALVLELRDRRVSGADDLELTTWLSNRYRVGKPASRSLYDDFIRGFQQGADSVIAFLDGKVPEPAEAASGSTVYRAAYCLGQRSFSEEFVRSLERHRPRLVSRTISAENSVVRIVLGVIAGFFAWVIMWVAGEKVLSALWPEAFGIHQRAFEEALTDGGEFTANTTHLLMHVGLGCIVSVASGFLAAVIAGENKRAPLVLGCLLLALGVLKAVMSWPYVPLWYHVTFTAILMPLAIVGGKLKTTHRAGRIDANPAEQVAG
jgi:hypothetical protein